MFSATIQILADDGPDPRNPQLKKPKNYNPNDEKQRWAVDAVRAAWAQLIENVLTITR
jgi:hypothetical protein